MVVVVLAGATSTENCLPSAGQPIDTGQLEQYFSGLRRAADEQPGGDGNILEQIAVMYSS